MGRWGVSKSCWLRPGLLVGGLGWCGMRVSLLGLLLLTGCGAFSPVTVRHDVPRRAEVVVAVMNAWRAVMTLPPVSLDNTPVEVAETCASFAALCAPLPPAIGCVPQAPRHTRECVPGSRRVIISPFEPDVLGYAVHGLVHVAAARARLVVSPGDRLGADVHHTDERLWGPTGVEGRALVALRRP